MQANVNGKSRDITQGTTLDVLLRELDLSPIRVAVEINEDLVSRRQFADTVICDGDRIEIVTFVGGG